MDTLKEIRQKLVIKAKDDDRRMELYSILIGGFIVIVVLIWIILLVLILSKIS